MNKSEQIAYLNDILLQEMPEYQLQAESFSDDKHEQRRLLRSLMNLRPPLPLKTSFLKIQDELLSSETKEKGIVKASSLSSISSDSKIILWRGDITRLEVDAIVDADNAALLGCFYPYHSCIDNAIHSAAGLQLRDECNAIMEEQGFPEPIGKAKITKAYNLPSKYIIHTVGPIVEKELTKQNCDELASCYRSCLELANEHHLSSIAFCCISTGEYHFPNEQAAEIAIDTVQNDLQNNSQIKQVIFNVFTEKDESIYRRLLHKD